MIEEPKSWRKPTFKCIARLHDLKPTKISSRNSCSVKFESVFRPKSIKFWSKAIGLPSEFRLKPTKLQQRNSNSLCLRSSNYTYFWPKPTKLQPANPFPCSTKFLINSNFRQIKLAKFRPIPPKARAKNSISLPIKPITTSNFRPKITKFRPKPSKPQPKKTFFIPTKPSIDSNFPPKPTRTQPRNPNSFSTNPSIDPKFLPKSIEFRSRNRVPFLANPSSNPNFRPRTAGLSSATLQALTQIHKLGPSLDIITYTTFIKKLGNSGKVVEACELFNVMKSTHKPDTVSFTILIQILCNSKRLDQALDLLQEMPFYDCKPDIFCYNTLINKFGEARREEQVRKLWSEMELTGIWPDVVSYSSLVKSLCISNKIDEALFILDQMEQDQHIKPNTYTYNTIIKAYLYQNQIEAAQRIMERMEINGSNPDLCSFNLFITYFGKLGKGLEACGYLEEMERRGIVASEGSYSGCVHGLIREGKVSETIELVQKIRVLGVSLSVPTLNKVICWLGKMGELDEAYGLFLDVKNPDEITMNTVVHMFYKHGIGEKAWEVFRLMNEKGIEASIVTFNILVHGLGREGRLEEASKLVSKMESGEGPLPDLVTYNCLLDGFCRAGRVDDACRMVLEIMGCGFQPDLITYNTLINGLISVDRTRDASKLFENMREKLDVGTVQ